MANKTYKKIIAKAAGFALMVGTLVGGTGVRCADLRRARG